MYYVTTKTRGNEPVQLFGNFAKRDEARKVAAAKGGTVRTQAEWDAIQAARKPAKPTLLDLAKDIAGTTKVRKTIGAKAKVAKRVVTPDNVLAEAAKYLATGVKAEASKVTLVRGLASWIAADNKTRLQRRDMFALIRASEKARKIGEGHEAYIADATISTQFQLVRSGKLDAKIKAAKAAAKEAKAA